MDLFGCSGVVYQLAGSCNTKVGTRALADSIEIVMHVVFVAPPVFRTQDLSEVLEEGESRRISLKYSGLPEPEVEWKLNGSLVRGVQIDSSNNTTSMYLKNADRSKHAGTYTVSLRNSAGSTTCNVKVQVKGKPSTST